MSSEVDDYLQAIRGLIRAAKSVDDSEASILVLRIAAEKYAAAGIGLATGTTISDPQPARGPHIRAMA